MYSIGFHGCSHLGYRMGSMNRSHSDGINLREHDGYIAHQTIYSEMIDAGVIGIVDGGDLFHVEHPSVRAVAEAISADDMRVAAGKLRGAPIWRRTNGGNHDNGASTHVSAVSHIERAELGSLAVFPGSPHAVGPFPGLYEVHQPDPDRELFLHFVSHNGLDSSLEDKGVSIDPQPIDGAVNIFVAHGIFEADGRLFGAADGHGAQRVIPVEWTNRAWSAVILSDYHTLGPIPGFGPEDNHSGPDVWMTGSGVRRGFSDEDAGRGWIEVQVDDAGRAAVIPHYIWQRPQIDFEPIDARGKSVAEIDRIVRQRIGDVTLSDAETENLTGDGGVIIRQVIDYTTQAQRQALASYQKTWRAMAAEAAYWSAPYAHPQQNRPAVTDVEEETDFSRLDFASEFNNRRTGNGSVCAALKAFDDEGADVVSAIVKTTTDTLQALQAADATS